MGTALPCTYSDNISIDSVSRFSVAYFLIYMQRAGLARRKGGRLLLECTGKTKFCCFLKWHYNFVTTRPSCVASASPCCASLCTAILQQCSQVQAFMFSFASCKASAMFWALLLECPLLVMTDITMYPELERFACFRVSIWLWIDVSVEDSFSKGLKSFFASGSKNTLSVV
jgi:hypothetical protein